MKSKENMISQLPNYERDNTIINEIYRVLGDKTDEFLYKIEDLYKQMNIDTATWGLDTWEKNLDIKTNQNLSLKERRANIKAKIKSKEKISTKTLENIIGEFYFEDVYVLFNKKLLFDIPLEHGSELELERIIKLIEQTKPAHLGYDISQRLKAVNTESYIGSVLSTGEDITVYPSIAKEPEINPVIYIGIALDGISETIELDNFKTPNKISTELDVRNIGNLINQLEQIVLYPSGGDEDL